METKLEINNNVWFLKDQQDRVIAYRGLDLNINKPKLPEPNIVYTEDEVLDIISNLMYDYIDSPAELSEKLKPLLKKPVGFKLDNWAQLSHSVITKDLEVVEIDLRNTILKGKYIYE